MGLIIKQFSIYITYFFVCCYYPQIIVQTDNQTSGIGCSNSTVVNDVIVGSESAIIDKVFKINRPQVCTKFLKSFQSKNYFYQNPEYIQIGFSKNVFAAETSAVFIDQNYYKSSYSRAPPINC